MTAFVFLEYASSSLEQSMLAVSSSTSTKTGIAPYWIIGDIVVGKHAATVMTSSPRLIYLFFSNGEVNVEKASRLAEDPELTSKE